MQKSGHVVADDLVVSLAYDLRDSEGDLIDSAGEDDPLEFIQGYGHIIPGLEGELYGLAVGDERDLVIEPADAYGEYDDENSAVVPLDMFPPGMQVEVGMAVELEMEDDDTPVEAIVTEIEDDEVTLDMNHPLAGETLHFHIKVVGLREATAEEKDHGHVHGPGHSHG
jgi:FKBP-type peptidyl-prolyl cis-trans isomerase SlyD